MDPELRTARLTATRAKARVTELRATVARRETDLARAQSALAAEQTSLKTAVNELQIADRNSAEIEAAVTRRDQQEAYRYASLSSMLAKQVAGDAGAREAALPHYTNQPR